MANYVGAPLARLIRERAYLGGELAKAETSLQIRRQEYRDGIAQRQRLTSLITELDQQIRKSRLDPSQIRAINATPRTSGLVHGNFSRELVAVLRQSDGAVMTREIIGHMLDVFNFPYVTPAEKDQVRRRIVRRLRDFVAKGAVQRMHDANDNQEGVWLWTGL